MQSLLCQFLVGMTCAVSLTTVGGVVLLVGVVIACTVSYYGPRQPGTTSIGRIKIIIIVYICLPCYFARRIGDGTR